MRVVPLSEVERRPRHVAVGEFDGVHLGHRAVISGSDTVLTFEPHPASVVRPGGGPKLLTTLELKAELIAELDVDELVVVPFDESFAHKQASEFVERVLVEKLAATHVSVGQNFRFGHRARGTAALLAGDGRFETRVVPLVEVDGVTVSSTRIRNLLIGGEVEAAARLLGSAFRIRGEVVPGEQRGRELGFPTANLVPDPKLACPGHGVYACRVGERPAAVNVGVRPTFGSDLQLLVEAYVLDFEGDLYGQQLTIEFAARLRGEQRFESLDELVAQIHRDVERTRELLPSGVE
ncbi:MAG TPA: bifunctional riboflavin kinase/FAD synthetase [Solirubrobacteraceae bacterium]|jgi:riboflavin kinase/FMN adenylyltransferase|nr:bifunctional riboflavin kinase/FAD synthetase [Solirubrobacteraceae bacterium]